MFLAARAVVLSMRASEEYWGTGGFQARPKDQEILEEGGGAGPSTLPRRDHE